MHHSAMRAFHGERVRRVGGWGDKKIVHNLYMACSAICEVRVFTWINNKYRIPVCELFDAVTEMYCQYCGNVNQSLFSKWRSLYFWLRDPLCCRNVCQTYLFPKKGKQTGKLCPDVLDAWILWILIVAALCFDLLMKWKGYFKAEYYDITSYRSRYPVQ